MVDFREVSGSRELVMVSNRLPVDRVVAEDGSATWQTSPGGLVTAVEPIVSELGCVWVGWPGGIDDDLEAFVVGEMRLEPISLSALEVENYYEGFANGTLWPLYHDVIIAPQYHRRWWDKYQLVNRRFAEKIAAQAPTDAIVWVHDYQLQLVPAMLRELRSDLTIAFFLHIPFPPQTLFAQLPWRRQISAGLLGADVIGFQREQDAANFRIVAERYHSAPAHGNRIMLPKTADHAPRTVLAQEFPISIDAEAFERLAAHPEVRRRAIEIRVELGGPKTVLLGIDRLDYTKGIHHRLRAYEELLQEDEVSTEDIVLVQVASPSRERVEAYREVREEVEETVGRINGHFGSIGHTPVVYLNQGYSREEMVALYLAADVMLVTPLRDGMNLVAKEYVACRADEQGVLVLSEFAGAADELRTALLVNPHNINGLKAALLRAINMPPAEQERRMQSLREALHHNTVTKWAEHYLGAVRAVADSHNLSETHLEPGQTDQTANHHPVFLPSSLQASLRRLAASPSLIVATDFDGTLAPIVGRPKDARILPRAQKALEILQEASDVQVVLLTGRALESLNDTGVQTHNWIISGSHGSELQGLSMDPTDVSSEEKPVGMPLNKEEEHRLGKLTRRLERALGNEPGLRLEHKPFGIVVHTREVESSEQAEELLAAAVVLGTVSGIEIREGKQVREFSVRRSSKGDAIGQIRTQFPNASVIFLGDDVTDEDVFATLSHDDVGVKVGEGLSQAQERVADPHAAAAVLAMLAELRTGIVIGS